jgi:PEGA domain
MAVAALCVCAAAPAFAQPHDKAAAEALFKEGRAALEKGDYTTACAKFAASLEGSGATGPLVNLAECEEKRGRIATALQLWRDVATRLGGTTDDRLPIAKERIAELEGRVPRITVKLPEGAPANTTIRVLPRPFGAQSSRTAAGVSGSSSQRLGSHVRIDAETTPRAPDQPVTVDPGDHWIIVAAPGYEPQKVTVTVAERELKEVTAGPGPKQATATAVEIKSVPSTQPAPGSLKRTIGFVVGGLGVAGLVVGGITGGVMLDQLGTVHDHCDPDTKRCDPEGLDAAKAGKSLGTLNAIAFAAGVIGIGVGVFLVVTSDGEAKAPATVNATAVPGGAAISMRMRF